VYGLAHSASGI